MGGPGAVFSGKAMLRSPATRLARAALSLLSLALLGSTSLSAAEQPSGERFGESTRVTAVDLLVDLVPPGSRSRRHKAPGDLTPDDFIVEAGGEERTVLAVQSTAESEAARWQIVILVDLTLSSQEQVRRGLWLLAQHTEQLVALGEVELVVTTPASRTLLRTADAETLDNALSGLFLKTETADALMRLRQNALDEISEYVVASAIDEAVADAARRERLVVQAVLDGWSSLLVERPQQPRRAVLWLGGGFDVDETAFYQRFVSTALGSPELGGPAREMAQIAAGYGWIVLPLAVDKLPDPPPDPHRYPWAAVPNMGVLYRSQAGSRLLDGIWDPDKAEAYIALADSLSAEGKLAEAEETLAKAVHHFADAASAAPRQAYALVRQAELRDTLGDREGALRLLREANAVDAVAIADYAPKVAMLAADGDWRALLAESSGGLEITGEASLQAAIRSLERRVRITYQLAGEAPGVLQPVRVTLRDKERTLRAAQWGRWSVPAEVSAARLRTLWRDGDLAEPRQMKGRCAPTADGSRSVTAAWSDAADNPQEGAHLRLTVGYQTANDETLVLLPASRHQPPDSGPVSASLPAAATSTFVLLEDLDDESWGVDVAVCR